MFCHRGLQCPRRLAERGGVQHLRPLPCRHFVIPVAGLDPSATVGAPSLPRRASPSLDSIRIDPSGSLTCGARCHSAWPAPPCSLELARDCLHAALRQGTHSYAPGPSQSAAIEPMTSIHAVHEHVPTPRRASSARKPSRPARRPWTITCKGWQFPGGSRSPRGRSAGCACCVRASPSSTPRAARASTRPIRTDRGSTDSKPCSALRPTSSSAPETTAWRERGVRRGDLVALTQNREPEQGDLVAVQIDGQVEIRRFVHTHTGDRLEPEPEGWADGSTTPVWTNAKNVRMLGVEIASTVSAESRKNRERERTRARRERGRGLER